VSFDKLRMTRIPAAPGNTKRSDLSGFLPSTIPGPANLGELPRKLRLQREAQQFFG
jgi:hypothetical protein